MRILEVSTGSSVETYKSTIAHIEEATPDLIVIEHSDALCDDSSKDDSNVNVLLSTLATLGYNALASPHPPLYELPTRL